MNNSLERRSVLITGGSRGIGRAITLAFAERGAKIAINFRENRAAAEQCAEEVKKLGASCLLVPGDVTVEADVERFVTAAQEAFGGIDILVNNAGFHRDNLLIRMTSQDWDDVVNTNLRGAFLCTRSVLRYMMRQRWGRIINISSVSGIAGNAGQANYSAAKAGLVGFTKAIAREVGSRGITANVVAPGLILTELTRDIGEGLIQAAIERSVLGRLGTPEEVAGAVVFLATDEASYITGQVIMVDGGLGM
ncbi:MAG TPA: 3-oxoacyl-[acyl-carrier-protein] reductase [Dehalococcoidia bacterium]|nr:3-oxoacyl-[acyl-carrier-protein] reductase [Dehalococcoidia bacterium]